MRKLKELKENWTHRLQFLIVFLKHWMLKKLLGRILVEKWLFPNPELYWIKLIQSEKIICKKKNNLLIVCKSIHLSTKLIMLCSKNNDAVMEMFESASVHFVRGAVRRCVVASNSVYVCVCVFMGVGAHVHFSRQLALSSPLPDTPSVWIQYELCHCSQSTATSIPLLWKINVNIYKNTYMEIIKIEHISNPILSVIPVDI